MMIDLTTVASDLNWCSLFLQLDRVHSKGLYIINLSHKVIDNIFRLYISPFRGIELTIEPNAI